MTPHFKTVPSPSAREPEAAPRDVPSLRSLRIPGESPGSSGGYSHFPAPPERLRVPPPTPRDADLGVLELGVA